jgi:tRNA pseudouridine38-40 synthase
MRAGLNGVLPADIAVLEARLVCEGFSPRRWTRRKTYRYRILNRRPRCPFRQATTWHLRQPLDRACMDRAAASLPGTWDWAAFRSAGCGAKTTIRTLESLAVTQQDDEIWIEAVGHGFLRHQVRILAGTLVEVGRGRMAAGDLVRVRDAGAREAAGPTAPAHGLWLVSVEMGDGPHIAGQEVP